MSTAAAVQYVRDLESLGADGAMVLPAMVYKADRAETLAHFRTVATSTRLPILIYNNPVGYTVDITPSMLAELSDLHNLQAIKESSADTSRITDIVNEVGDRYAIFAGVDTLALESAMLGAVGWIAGVGLAFPYENQRLWDLAMAGEWEKARDIYRWFMPLLRLDLGPHFVQKIKLALQETGLGTEWVRAPRLTLSGAERDEVLAIIRTGIANRPTLN
jgi:4-hydroxy-tetrahydrodipicolinate synthase